jgi:hypothetical protein
MNYSSRIIAIAIILASCGTSQYKNSNNANSNKNDSAKASNVGGYPAKPSPVDTTGAQSGNMSNTFRDSVEGKRKK